MYVPSPLQDLTDELPSPQGPGPQTEVRCSVITVADDLTLEDDACGRDVEARLRAAGHRVVERTVVPRNPGPLSLVIRHWVTVDVDVIVIVADTWSIHASTTCDVVYRFLDRELHAFGQLFASLSFGEIGASAIAYRALAGLSNKRLLFLLPATDWALHLAMDKLITPRLVELLLEIGVLPRGDS